MPVEPWHWPVPPGLYPPARSPMWAKADLVVTVALERLDRVMIRDAGGKRTYHVFQLNETHLATLRRSVGAALGFT